MKPDFIISVILALSVGAAAGVIAGVQFAETPIAQSIKNATSTRVIDIDKTGFVPAKIDIESSTISLSNGCYTISFGVTDDQAFSIHHGISKEIATRPLTHDILVDILREFNIMPVHIRIERFGDEIYYARAFVQQGDSVLDLDLRPSDAIALSLRTGDVLYMNQSMLQEKGTYTC